MTKMQILQKKGDFASALLMPPMGLLGAWVGLTVRAKALKLDRMKFCPGS